MTSSSTSGRPSRTLIVESKQLGVTLTVRNHAWRVVASGVERISVALPEGIYMVEAQFGRDAWTGYATLRGRGVEINVPRFYIKSAVPIDGYSHSHEYHVDALRNARERTDFKVGSGARILLMARNWAPSGGRSQGLPELTLERWRGDVIADLGIMGRIETGGDAVGTCTIEVNPGDYVLNVATEQIRFSQAVTALEGWEAQVFVLQDFSAVENERSAVAMRPIVTSTMALTNQYGGDPAIYELLEAGQVALASERPGLGRAVFDKIAQRKWDAPILGLMAAHILLLARDFEQTVPPGNTTVHFVREDFETILHNTADLIGKDHPDIIALRTQSETLPLSEVVEISTPPIFSLSWEVLLKASRPGGPTLVRDNLWRRVRATSNFAPFFSWSRAEAAPSAQEYSLEKSLIRELSAPVEVESDMPQPEIIAKGLPQRADLASRKPTLSELASYAPKPQLHRMVREAETLEEAISAVATYGRLPYSAAQKLFESGTTSELIARLRR